jgi:multicomponent Na+:H+ antiporter subunit B
MTPGGGFQGGIVLAAAPLAVFIAGRYMRMKLIAPSVVVEFGDAIGAAGYGLVGLGGLIFAGIFFKNFIPFGIPGHLLSAGQMPLASIAVGLEVSGAFLVGWTEFLDQAMIVQGGEEE